MHPTVFFEGSFERPLVLESAAVALHTAATQPTASAAPEQPGLQPSLQPGLQPSLRLGRFGTAARNGRLPLPLPRGTEAQVRHAIELPLRDPPTALQQSADRILVEQQSYWSLYSASDLGRPSVGEPRPGIKPVASGAHLKGEIALDATNGLIYLSDASGMVVARRLSDGKLSFAISPHFSNGYERAVLGRQGPRLLLWGVELPRMSHAPRPPSDLTDIEVQDLDEPMRLDEVQFAVSAKRKAVLLSRTRPLLSALHGDTLIIAAPDELYWLDAATLRVRHAVRDSFTPLSLSTDETHAAHLIVQRGERPELWRVSPAGERSIALPLPPPGPERPRTPPLPPLVGLEHDVRVIFGDQVVAVGADGKQRWQRQLPEPAVGAALGSDNRLLITAGSKLLQLGTAGERRILHDFTGEQLCTQPLVAAPNLVRVATETRLYELALHPHEKK